MKRNEYNGEYDAFETPDNLWSNIESKLDQHQPEKKRRNWIYWSLAGVASISGIVFLSMNANIGKVESKPIVAQNNEEPVAEQDAQSEFDYRQIKTLKKEKVQSNQQQQELTATHDLNTKVYQAEANVSYNASTTNGTTVSGLAGNHNKHERKVIRGTYNEAYLWDIDEPTHGSTYDEIIENKFIKVTDEKMSTFSIDVDGASYSDVRGMINRNVLPNPNAVRLEEFINYFPYNYNEPDGDHPFSINSEVVNCPWNTKHKLMKIGIKGESIPVQNLPKNNLVFLLDVSGSMMSQDKLDLIKKGFGLLVQELREQDRVSIVVYAGAAGLVLPPTSGQNKDKIMDAINHLEAGGNTAGGQGIELAYNTAQKYFDPNGNNRVILATDGDFNVGLSDDASLVRLIERKRKSGVFLTVLGVGHDNFQSSKMEKLANNGNGNFSYIDNILEAKKVLVTEMGGTLKTIAKDVKIQVDFNTANVESYRLIGYENRMLENEDFDNDAIDAGELGAGHTVTAVYEIVPGEQLDKAPAMGSQNKKVIKDMLNYASSSKFQIGDVAILRFRYKKPSEDKSRLIETTIRNMNMPASADMIFIQSVIEFGLILRDSDFKGTASFDRVLENARTGLGRDPYGYRSEFIQIVKKAKILHERRDLN